jgi:hypothetical protein
MARVETPIQRPPQALCVDFRRFRGVQYLFGGGK